MPNNPIYSVLKLIFKGILIFVFGLLGLVGLSLTICGVQIIGGIVTAVLSGQGTPGLWDGFWTVPLMLIVGIGLILLAWPFIRGPLKPRSSIETLPSAIVD